MVAWSEEAGERAYEAHAARVLEQGEDVGPADDEWWLYAGQPPLEAEELAGVAAGMDELVLALLVGFVAFVVIVIAGSELLVQLAGGR